MTLDDFRQSLTATEPPAELTLALAGLWWDGKGDWRRAHESAQHGSRRHLQQNQVNDTPGVCLKASENALFDDWG
jgi:hypothetical protein